MAKYAYHQKDGTQDTLVTWLEAKGCRYEHIGKPVDGLLCVPVRHGWLTVPVEFKTRYGKLRPGQKAFFEKWLADRYELRTELECAAMLAELKYVQPAAVHREGTSHE